MAGVANYPGGMGYYSANIGGDQQSSSAAETRERMTEASRFAVEKSLLYRADIQQAVCNIEATRQEELDWDGKPGLPVDFRTVQRSRALIIEAAEEAQNSKLAWQNPSVAPTPQGGINLSWRRDGRWTVLTIFPPYQDTICITKGPGEPTQRTAMSDFGAVKRVIWALGGAGQ